VRGARNVPETNRTPTETDTNVVDAAKDSAQLQTEEIVHELLALPEVADARSEIRERFFAPRVLNEAARQCLDRAVEEASVAATLAVAGRDPGNPHLTWYEFPPHTTFGRQIGGARYGFDNPDRTFRFFFSNPACSYEIRGRRPTDGSDSFYLLLESCEDRPPGWGYPLAFLYMENIDFADDGTFCIAVDGTPTNGRRNHLHLPRTSAHILIRETMLKWDVEMPTPLSVTRNGGPEISAPTFDERRQSVFATIVAQAENAFLWYDFALANVSPNTVATPQIRPAPPGETPWGMTTTGRFAIAEDEAFVFTIGVEDAKYLGVQIADPWMLSIDYTNHTSCLNHEEIDANADGTVTYVVAATDPGIANWLDTAGITDGVMLLRWELLQGTPDPASTVRDCRVVKLAELSTVLPPDLPRISQEQRRRQVDVRRNGIRRRQERVLHASNSVN
jgi:hypothetical protein